MQHKHSPSPLIDERYPLLSKGVSNGDEEARSKEVSGSNFDVDSFDEFQRRAEHHRIWYLLLGLSHSVVASGVIYGWPALALILRDEGIYSESCQKDNQPHHEQCGEQTLGFTKVYTAGPVGLLAGLFLMGMVLDRYGPKISACIGCLFFFLSCFLLGYSSSEFDGFVLGFGFLGLGGAGVHLSLVHLCNLYPERKLTIISLFNGTFSVSSYVFLGMRGLYVTGSLTRGEIFMIYAGVICYVLITAILFAPMRPFVLRMPTDAKSQGEEMLKRSKWSLSIWDQLFSAEWILNVVFISVNILSLQFYVGTAADQLLLMGDTDAVYTVLLNFLGGIGVVFTPFVGWSLDKKGFAFTYFLVNLWGILVMFFALIDNLPLQIATFICWSLYRMFLFSATYSFVSNIFGFTNFGKLNGLTLTISAIVSILQIPLSMAVEGIYNGDYFYVNLFLLLVHLPLFYFVYWLWRKSL